MQQLMELWRFEFFRWALLVGLLLSICSALLGVTLVLRRFSMISDGLSHVGFGALAIAAAVGWAPLPVAIPAVVLAAFFLLRGGGTKLRGDAAIALLSTSCLAVGVLAVSATGGTNTDLMNYLFGNIWATDKADFIISLALCAVTLTGFGWFRHRIFSLTFDETFAKATGLRTGAWQLLTAALTSLTIVLGMRMLGTMLISSLVIFPTLISMRVCKSFAWVTCGSMLVSLATFLTGFVISAVWPPRGLPTGATIVAVNLLTFGLFSLIGFVRGKRKFNC